MTSRLRRLLRRSTIERCTLLALLGAGVLVVAWAVLIVWAVWPIDSLSIQTAAGFGDSFGALSALFSAMAFAVLIGTLLLQRKELQLQRRELALTRAEMKQSRLEMREHSRQFKKQAAIAALQSFVQATAMRGEQPGEIEQVAEGHPSGKKVYRVEPRTGADPREIVNQLAAVTRIQIRIGKELDRLLDDAFPKEPPG